MSAVVGELRYPVKEDPLALDALDEADEHGLEALVDRPGDGELARADETEEVDEGSVVQGAIPLLQL